MDRGGYHLDGVDHGHGGGHSPAGRVDVECDRPVRVLVPVKQQLGDD